LTATAGRDINVETTTRSGTTSAGGNSFARTSLDRVAGLYVTGDGSNGSGTLVAQAGRDVNLVAGKIGNAGKDGATTVTAGHSLNLTTVGTASSNSINWDAKNYRKDSTTTEVGSQIQASGAILLKAGVDINARAADVQAGTSLTAAAGNDINLVSGVSTFKVDEGHQTTKKGFLSRKTITTRDTLDRSSALGTSLGGDTVTLVAGNDIKVIGSAIAGDGDVSLVAAKALTIAAATGTSSESHHRSVKQKGFLSGGGFGISYGTRTTTTDQQQDASIQSGQARSIVGSTGGNLNLSAGTAINVAGSDLAAAEDMNLAGRSVTIAPGQDQVNGKFVSKVTQDALTLAVGGTVVNAIGTIQDMSAAAGQTKNTRVKALAAATAAMAAKNAASDVAAQGLSISLSLTAGHSESEQTQTTSSTSHVGSVLAAGNNIAITATGGGAGSNVAIIGSDVGAKNNISLRADNQVNLLAAQDLESQHSESKSMSAAAGIAASYSSKGGAAFGITGSVSASRGTMDGEGVTQINSYIDAGAQLSLASGGDTNLKGAVASASQVIADVKGNLNIASLQDTATFDSKDQSASVSGTYGYGANTNASVSQSKIHSDYASVQEQSGIQAGDGGFQIKVGGNTDLKGGIIASTQAGGAASSLATATLTHSDIANHATMKASSVGLAGGVTVGGGDVKVTKDGGEGAGPGGSNLMNLGASAQSGGLPGIASTSDSSTSSTRSGIGPGTLTITDDAIPRAATGKGAQESIVGISRDVTAGKDTSASIANIFDPNEVHATLAITAAFSATAAKAVGDAASEKLIEAERLRLQENQETDPARKAELAQRATDLEDNWKEDGAARAALHTTIGGLVGGAGGALGAGATALAIPAIADGIAKLDVSTAIKSALTLAAGGAVGAVAGGHAGAAAAVNEVENNYLSHVRTAFNKPSEQDQFDKAVAQCNSGNASACKTRDDMVWLSQTRDVGVAAACSHGPSADCHAVVTIAQQAGNKVTIGNDGKAYIYPIGTPELVVTPRIGAGSFNEQVSKSTSEGLLLAGLAAPASKVVAIGVEGGAVAWTSYRTASAAYSLAAASGTGAVVGGGSYTGGVLAGAIIDNYFGSGQNIGSGFLQGFSYSGLGAAMTVGAVTGMYGTTMFRWAGLPNALSNAATLPGAVIRINSVAMGQGAGRAAQGAVKSSEKN
jgi:filamentous hemagglutinin